MMKTIDELIHNEEFWDALLCDVCEILDELAPELHRPYGIASELLGTLMENLKEATTI